VRVYVCVCVCVCVCVWEGEGRIPFKHWNNWSVWYVASSNSLCYTVSHPRIPNEQPIGCLKLNWRWNRSKKKKTTGKRGW